ncbi:MAG: GNAT family N-acetyltransferase [Oscillospiraceae bacterium]|nr:GNAT family N-acetyltransferase [Oscillospiraceae bacterium]
MDSNAVKFRKANSEDAGGWYTLVNRVWRDTYHHIFPEEVFLEKEDKLETKIASFNDWAKNDSESITYVAECDGKIIGIMCGAIRSFYEPFSSEYADLIALYVDPAFQGRGIGSAFRNVFAEWASGNGASQYVVGVLKENRKARRVYEAWGGKLSEYEKAFVKHNVSYPVVFYTFHLESTRRMP